MVKIYAIIHPITKEIKYIGKTKKSLGLRLSAHLYESKVAKEKTHKHNWILKCTREGLRPEIILLEECNEDEWQELEIKWINKFKSKALTNTAEGGLGGCGKTLSAEHKAKIKATLLEGIRSGRINNMNPSRIEKLRKSRTGFKVSESTKQKLREINTGKTQSYETKLKKSRGVYQYDLDGNLIMEHLSLREAAKFVSGSRGNISNVCCGRSKTHKGFIWKYINNN
jgi:group I intron endonuclease